MTTRAMILFALWVAFTGTSRADLNFTPVAQPELTQAMADLKAVELARKGGVFPSGYWWPWGLRCADLDGDGRCEVYVNFHSPVGGMLFWNKTPAGGPLKFVRDTTFDDAATETDPSGWGNRKLPLENAVTPLDIDGDGRLDLVGMGDESSFKRPNIRNQATGLTLWGKGISFTGSTSAPLLIQDRNGDGRPDFTGYTRSYGKTSETRKLLNADGTFTSVSMGEVPYPAGLPADIVTELDRLKTVLTAINKVGGPLFYPAKLNGDDREDLIVQYANAYTADPVYRWVKYLVRNEAGVLEDKTAALGLTAQDVIPGDYNGDGRTDLLCCQGVGSGLFICQPDGTFTNMSPPNAAKTSISDWAKATSAYGYKIRAVDLDGDGDLDLVMTSMRNRGGRVYQCMPDGTYVRYLAFRHFDAQGFDVADVDGDGDLDIVAGGQPDDGTVTVYVNGWKAPALPPKPTGTVSGPETGLVGQELAFTADVTGTGELGYAWDFGDGGIGMGPAVTHTYAAAGTYTVSLAVTDPLGQTGNGTLTVTVAEPGPARGSRLPLPSEDQTTPAFARLRGMVDRDLTAGRPYGGWMNVPAYLYRLTGERKYGDAAVALLVKYLDTANAAIAAGTAPAIARDQYLYVGQELAALCAVYDWCYGLLTPALKGRFEAFAEQAVFNCWNPQKMVWGGKAYTRGGAGLTKYVDNYRYSIQKASVAWALVSQSKGWLDYMTTDLAAAMVEHGKYPEGGGPEGTGYSPAVRYFFEVLRLWKDAGRGDLANQNTHVRRWIDYWVHATVPGFTHFAPFGDQARESTGKMYDYHRQNILEAVRLSPGTPEAARGRWWLASAYPKMVREENAFYDTLADSGPTNPPVATYYAAPTVGHYFWRSGWGVDSSFLALSAGVMRTDHDHGDKGSFFLWKGKWQTVTANTFNIGGIKDLPGLMNTLRFDRAGVALPQKFNIAPTTDVTMTVEGLKASLDLSALYSVPGLTWRRALAFDGRVLSLVDECETPADVTATWQLQLPTQPTMLPAAFGGPDLTVWLDAALTAEDWTLSTLDRPGAFKSGWRVSATGARRWEARLILKSP